MMIGDVRGKGMQAVALVNALMGAFHGSALHRPDLPDVVRDLEAQIQSAKNREDGEAGESFATAIVAETSRDHSVLRLANRGHPTPLLVHAGKAVPLEPEVPSLPLGLADLGGPDAPVDEYELPPGGTLVTFTGGVIEARDRSGVFFDPVPALARRLPRIPKRYWTPCSLRLPAMPKNSRTILRPSRSPASRPTATDETFLPQRRATDC
ncbi:PP2C family protein-serine/threonine phosphatase [Streptomyces pristinaespiralis]|uniref:PP2C family protein-serine/threonine phosphatase n=1 Tax=Streptomyces pristinaespiralis TaxID=38300 RepID=UPI00384D4261